MTDDRKTRQTLERAQVLAGTRGRPRDAALRRSEIEEVRTLVAILRIATGQLEERLAAIAGTVDTLEQRADGLEDTLGRHTHPMTDVVGLIAALDGKADAGHGHAQADIAGLTATLSGKADTGHGHLVEDLADHATAPAIADIADPASASAEAVAGTVNLVLAALRGAKTIQAGP